MTILGTSGNLLLLPRDGGIIYTETDLRRVFPEPLNTLTAAIFIVIAFYWMLLLIRSHTRHLFLFIASFILLVGSFGGFAYHGLRRYPIFIAMDWVPILVLCMMAAAYFWFKITRRRFLVISLMSLCLFIQLFTRQYLERFSDLDWGVSISYSIMALMVIAPVLIFASRTKYLHSKFVLWSIAFFAVALMCRELDKYVLLASGTHFLWHIFGGMATHLMFRYVFLIDRKDFQTISKDSGRL